MLIEKSPLVYFGLKNRTLADLEKDFPQLSFRTLHQVHGIDCVQASTSPAKADAHFTSEKNVALAIQTADCLPVLAYHPENKMIWAIHAGWRGVVGCIISRTLSQIANREKLRVWVGPHIRKEHFLVRQDIVGQFPQSYVTKVSDEHFSVDITQMALDELGSLSIGNIWTSTDDTHALSQYHSFRRDKTSGRQWSFVALEK